MESADVLQTSKINYLSFPKFKPLFWITILFFTLWFIPPPVGLSLQAWHLFIIFTLTIISIILNVFPMGAIAVIAISVCTISNTLTIQQALSTFSSSIVWLILIAYMLARGFIKTGLGNRIAYYFTLVMGKSTLGLGYALIAAEFLLAPFMPCNTARGAGVIYPIVTALIKEYENIPTAGNRRSIGAYLIKLCYQANIITSAMFLTAAAGNPLIVSLATNRGVAITWTGWALAALLPGILSLLILPLALYVVYPPQIKSTPEAPDFARRKLAEMGRLRKEEWIMLLTLSLLLTLWILGSLLGIEATTAAFLGLAILLITKVLTWEDVLKEKHAWHNFIWLTTLLMMSNYLAEFGLMTWASDHLHVLVGSLPSIFVLPTVALIYFYIHYAFAGMVAHISALYTAFALVAINSGADPTLTVLSLAFFSSLCACITHYGTGTAAVYFSAGYVSIREWWKAGGILSIIYIIIWGFIGSLWWKLIGIA